MLRAWAKPRPGPLGALPPTLSGASTTLPRLPTPAQLPLGAPAPRPPRRRCQSFLSYPAGVGGDSPKGQRLGGRNALTSSPRAPARSCWSAAQPSLRRMFFCPRVVSARQPPPPGPRASRRAPLAPTGIAELSPDHRTPSPQHTRQPQAWPLAPEKLGRCTRERAHPQACKKRVQPTPPRRPFPHPTSGKGLLAPPQPFFPEDPYSCPYMPTSSSLQAVNSHLSCPMTSHTPIPIGPPLPTA